MDESLLDILADALFMAWRFSEVAISLITMVNRLNQRARAEAHFSFLGIWLALIVTVALTMITGLSRYSMTKSGDTGALRRLLGWLGGASLVSGIVIRLAAVATCEANLRPR